ncbi:hypothetical protein [Flexivirga oryzae]|uniref:Putative membrane protein n=1 Tax=Flexivirga oryzae TaxID=1794944 RepID=A0A839N5M5_9MICO|nr:hypothetical protein [Flexivirga oryzae]MBB2890515.1 putative membrane protein [Flexivirga oryzae]
MNQPVRPMVEPVRPGRRWWTASAVLHALCAVTFAAGVWGGVHWLHRINSDAYYQAHKDADADMMIMLEFLVVLLMGACLLAVIYAFVGFGLSLSGLRSGPVMLIFGSAGAAVVGGATCSEVFVDELVIGATGIVLLGLAAAGIVAGCMAMGYPQRPPRPRPEDMVRRRYPSGPPYPRPPGR